MIVLTSQSVQNNPMARVTIKKYKIIEIVIETHLRKELTVHLNNLLRLRMPFHFLRLLLILYFTLFLCRSKKPRRTPSPIIYNNSSYREDDSPSRHRHKKHKKSRHSSSRSRSRSRDRRSSKKLYRREKSPSPAARKHHKKKSHRTSTR